MVSLTAGRISGAQQACSASWLWMLNASAVHSQTLPVTS